MTMFIHVFCLCPLSLTIKLNFDISKVAYSLVPMLHFASILTFCSITDMNSNQLLKRKGILSPVMRFVSGTISQLIVCFMFDCEVKPGKKTRSEQF